MTTRKTLHIISQAHLDPVWLWPLRDGYSEALTTMQSAVDRMRETPDFTFSRSSAITYRWAQEADPRLFAEIRKHIAEGRWEVVNGWIEQPDCNIPSAESFVRHCLYGKGYCARELGVDVRVGYNVDTFGHAAGLPQILAHAGYGYYVFMRPQPHECDLPLLFWWESPDGSRVLTWRIPHGYGQGNGATADDIESFLRAQIDDYFVPGFSDGAFFFGVGNHGGGPTRAHLARLVALQEDETLPRLHFSTLATYFTALENSPAFATIPVIRGELQHHARGCYAAMGEIKQENRRAERTLGKAETLATLAGLEATFPYPGAALREAWWKVLFNQFHDIMAGSSILSAYVQARDALGAACDTGDSVALRALHTLARRVDTSGAPEGVLFAANILPWERTAIIQCAAIISQHGDTPITHLCDAQGRALPLQWLPRGIFDTEPNGFLGHLIATAPLPAGGYRTFHLAHGAAPDVPSWESFITVAPDVPGISSVRANNGAELLAAPLSLVVIDDTSDTWGHDIRSYQTELGRPTLTDTTLLADGPVCRVVRQHATWEHSTITLDIITYRELEVVELRLEINWQERHQILKLEVPSALQKSKFSVKIPGGIITRTANGEEEPCQDFIALHGECAGQDYTLGLINAGSYSTDCANHRMQMVVLRSAPFAHHDPAQLPEYGGIPFQDQGRQVRRYWLVRGQGAPETLGLSRRADEMQTPAETVMDSAHPGTAPWEHSFLSVAPDSVAVAAIKGAEDGVGVVIRLQEMHGMPVEARLMLGNAMHTFALKAWELATVRLMPTSDGVRVIRTNLLECEENV